MSTKEQLRFARLMYQSLWDRVYPEKANARSAAYHRANPAKIKVAHARYYKANSEKLKARSAAWRKANPEKVNVDYATRRKANPEKYKAHRIKRYNLTVEDWDKIFAYQIQCCAICGRPATDFKYALSVDHDHSTHIVRGLLCWNCNSLLPNRKELILLLKKAIRYLEAPPAVKVLGVRLANPVRRKRRTKRKT